MFYSKSTGGFYAHEVHGKNMPADVVEITKQEHAALLEGQFLWKVIGADSAGRPVLQEPLFQQLAEIERDWRDAALAACQWLRDRHRDERDLGMPTTLQAEQFAELLVYRQALRDWPQSELFPVSEHRPVPPLWLESMTP